MLHFRVRDAGGGRIIARVQIIVISAYHGRRVCRLAENIRSGQKVRKKERPRKKTPKPALPLRTREISDIDCFRILLRGSRIRIAKLD
jgi:hypothetical protein